LLGKTGRQKKKKTVGRKSRVNKKVKIQRKRVTGGGALLGFKFSKGKYFDQGGS